MVPLSAFASTGGHDSSLEAQTDSEEVMNQRTTYKEDRALVLNGHTTMSSKISCGDKTSPVSFNESLLYPFHKFFEPEATLFRDEGLTLHALKFEFLFPHTLHRGISVYN